MKKSFKAEKGLVYNDFCFFFHHFVHRDRDLRDRYGDGDRLDDR